MSIVLGTLKKCLVLPSFPMWEMWWWRCVILSRVLEQQRGQERASMQIVKPTLISPSQHLPIYSSARPISSQSPLLNSSLPSRTLESHSLCLLWSLTHSLTHTHTHTYTHTNIYTRIHESNCLCLCVYLFRWWWRTPTSPPPRWAVSSPSSLVSWPNQTTPSLSIASCLTRWASDDLHIFPHYWSPMTLT